MILGREPESEDAYQSHLSAPDFETLRQTLITSNEGVIRLRTDMRHARSRFLFSYFQPAWIFIHIAKTGGTSIHKCLAPGFSSDRVCPGIIIENLKDYSIKEVNQYDFFSGHISFGEALSIPRTPKMMMSVFREPTARLISYYRYCRSQKNNTSNDYIVTLAKNLTPEDFFCHETVRQDPRINNNYLRTFVDLPNNADSTLADAALPIACARLESLDAIGLTERLSETVEMFASKTKTAFTIKPIRSHVTDDLAKDSSNYETVAVVELTAWLQEILHPLIKFDQVIYKNAIDLFENQKHSHEHPCQH